METDCFECYYCGECDGSVPCEHCDRCVDELTDDDVIAITESMRDEYRSSFFTYIREFNGQ